MTESAPKPWRYVIQHPGRFLLQVLKAFRANQGFLLAGAVAYYTLLSIVPMFALLLILLSQLIDPLLVMEAVTRYLELLTPGKSTAIGLQVEALLENWKLVGVTGLLLLLFFSSLAFTVVENAMSMIFFHRVRIYRRHFMVSAILPYLYILSLALGMLLVSLIAGWLHALDGDSVHLLGQDWSMSRATANLLYVTGILGEVLLLTSIYLVMPLGRLAPSHALIGGVVATVLWEATRHVLVWYFSTLSFVNVIYGSFATTIVILLSFEAGAIILLLGAQVIAEYERIGKPENGEPPPLTT